jgi:hypothetical protein
MIHGEEKKKCRVRPMRKGKKRRPCVAVDRISSAFRDWVLLILGGCLEVVECSGVSYEMRCCSEMGTCRSMA